MKTELIDTHVHLYSHAYAADLGAVLARAVEAGVVTCIVPGTTLKDSRAAVALAKRQSLYAAVGIHPTEADNLTPQSLDELRALAQHPRVVAIGEIGLDYYWPRQTKRDWPCAAPARQREALQAQLELAAELHLPVIIHDREAHEDMLEILAAWVAGGARRNGTLHAYDGGPERLAAVLELGFYIGMDGPITYRKSPELPSVARQVPLERLLLETDGPYLTPAPHRGQRNEPAYLPLIAQRIAELRGMPVETLIETTTANARQLFGIGEE